MIDVPDGSQRRALARLFLFNVPNHRLLLLKRKIDAGLSHKKAPPKRSLNGAPFSEDLFVGSVGSRQIVAMLAAVRHGPKGRTIQWTRLQGIPQRRAHFVQALRIRREVKHPERSRRFGVDCLHVDLILVNGAIGEHFLHQRHDQVFAERVHRIIGRVCLQFVGRAVSVQIFP
jgi:hypothetical protein